MNQIILETSSPVALPVLKYGDSILSYLDPTRDPKFKQKIKERKFINYLITEMGKNKASLLSDAIASYISFYDYNFNGEFMDMWKYPISTELVDAKIRYDDYGFKQINSNSSIINNRSYMVAESIALGGLFTIGTAITSAIV